MTENSSSDDDQDPTDLPELFETNEAVPVQRQLHSATLFTHIKRFIPDQTIEYIQYYLLRIPLIMIYDYLLSDQFMKVMQSNFDRIIETFFEDQNLILPAILFLRELLTLFADLNIFFMIPVAALLLLIILLLSRDRYLVVFYSYMISCSIIIFSYLIHRRAGSTQNLFLVQLLLLLIYIRLFQLRPRISLTEFQIHLCFPIPVLYVVNRYSYLLNFNAWWLNFYFLFWMIVHLSEILIFQRKTLINIIRREFWNRLTTLIGNGGVQVIFNYVYDHIPITQLLKLFWLAKILVVPLGIRTLYTSPFLNQTIMLNNLTPENNQNGIESHLNNNETLVKTTYFTTIFYATETVLCVMSLACYVSSLMKIIFTQLFRILHVSPDEIEHMSKLVGVIFFLLLFQSNLLHLDLDQRHVPLIRAISLVIVASLHFLHNVLEPTLLKVAMQRMMHTIILDDNIEDENVDCERENSSRITSMKIEKWIQILTSFHHRQVYNCLAIIAVLILYLIGLWRVTSFSTWLLAITGLTIDLIIRCFGSLVQYALHVFDGHNLLSDSETFEEYIFRTKAVTSFFEFILAICLLLNGFYVLCFEARGALRAFMLATHTHLNIVKKFRKGLEIIRNRRTASENVNQLPAATEAQIDHYNSICSICLNNLKIDQTCVTPCVHLFHRKCLQKVFHVTRNCPLCSQSILASSKLFPDRR